MSDSLRHNQGRSNVNRCKSLILEKRIKNKLELEVVWGSSYNPSDSCIYSPGLGHQWAQIILMMTIRNSRSPLSPVPLRQTLNGFMDLWDLLGTTRPVAQAAEAGRYFVDLVSRNCNCIVPLSENRDFGLVAVLLLNYSIEVQCSVNSRAGSSNVYFSDRIDIKPQKS